MLNRTLQPRNETSRTSSISRINKTSKISKITKTTKIDDTPVVIPKATIRPRKTYTQIAQIENITLDDGVNRDNMLSMDDLLHRIGTYEFLENFWQSLLFSYQYKRNIYIKKIQEAKILDISNTSKNSQTSKIFESLIFILNQKIEKYSELTQDVVDEIYTNISDAINDEIDGLKSLIGRDDIKNILATQVISFANNPMTFLTKINNYALYGPSGVGKTKLGQTLAYFYSKCGILIKSQCLEVSASKMVDSHVSATPRVARNILESALDGVLFIDEAYTLSGTTAQRKSG